MCKMDILKYYGFVVGAQNQIINIHNFVLQTPTATSAPQNAQANQLWSDVANGAGAADVTAALPSQSVNRDTLSLPITDHPMTAQNPENIASNAPANVTVAPYSA